MLTIFGEKLKLSRSTKSEFRRYQFIFGNFSVYCLRKKEQSTVRGGIVWNGGHEIATFQGEPREVEKEINDFLESFFGEIRKLKASKVKITKRVPSKKTSRIASKK